MLPHMMNNGALFMKSWTLVVCTWLLSQFIIAINGATLPGTPSPTLQPEEVSSSIPHSSTQSSSGPTYGPAVPPTPQSSGRLGTNEYLAGFIICLTMNIIIIAVAFFFLCYLGKLSSRSGDEIDSAEPRQTLPWKEALRPVAEKVFKKR